MTEPYVIHAVKYAHHDRRGSENLIYAGDLHEVNMPLDYFVWALVNSERTIVVDIGFSAETAEARGRDLIRCPTEGLKMVGVDAATVEDVIITHMHYDHVGNFGLFPKATFHLQDREVAFATGRQMTKKVFSMAFSVDDVVDPRRRQTRDWHDRGGGAPLPPRGAHHRAARAPEHRAGPRGRAPDRRHPLLHDEADPRSLVGRGDRRRGEPDRAAPAAPGLSPRVRGPSGTRTRAAWSTATSNRAT